MSILLRLSPLTNSNIIYIPSRSIFLPCRLQLDQNWRESHGLTKNPNAYGPLTNGPDYTYLDGRPTPIGSRLKSRLLKQREHAKKIIELSKEMDFAVQLHEQRKQEEEDARKRRLESKLKPKGMPLLMKAKEKK